VVVRGTIFFWRPLLAAARQCSIRFMLTVLRLLHIPRQQAHNNGKTNRVS